MNIFSTICVGIAFVLVGLVYALSDRWQRQLIVQGVITRKPHRFDHLFVMWTLKQFLQLGLFFLWKFIENNWFGCSRLMHGERDQENTNVPAQTDDEPISLDAHDGDVFAQNRAEYDDELLLPADPAPKKRKNKTPSKLIYFPPAFFALTHILLLYFGLKLTYSSSFIMLKGTVVFFTALLSLAFLAQPLACYVWFGVVVATLGFAVSGISDYVNNPMGYEKYGIAAGDLLILMSQIMFATKIIYEEKFITKYSIHPMSFLGCEGIYGSIFAAVFLLIFNFVDAAQYSNLPNGRLEDFKDFALQFANSWEVMLAVFGSLASYILYTYLGMFLIRELGALGRIMTETLIWSFYWAICLALNWEHFFIAQVPGLCVIFIGVLIYSHILKLPFSSHCEGAVDTDPDNNKPLDNVNDFDDNRENPPMPGPINGDDNYRNGDDDNFRHEVPVPVRVDIHENDADNLRRRGI